MDLEQLNKIDTSNAAQVKALQTFLKTRGYYNGPIDGKWGGGTTEGAVKLRTDLTTASNTARDTAVANQEANDPTNNAIRGATEVAPYAVGAGLGFYGGHKMTQSLEGKNAAARQDISQIANNPKISGAQGERSIADLRSARNKRAGLQFLAPAALFASAEGMRRYVAPMMGPKPEDQKWINLAANADQGAAIGLTVHQLMDLKNQVGPVGSQTNEALIRTRAAAERAPPPPPGAQRQNSERLTAAARAAGATGKLTKATAADFIAKSVTDANRAAVLAELPAGTTAKAIASTVKRLASKPGSSSIIAPLIGAGVAYDAASSEAEAAGATPAEAQTRGTMAGTGAFAVTGGAMYGASKLPQVGRFLGPAANALAAYDYASQAKGFRDAMPPEQRGEPSSLLSHAMPLAMRGAEDIASIARTPGRLRDAARSAFTPGNATSEEIQGSMYPEAVPASSNQLAAYSMGRAGPLSNASALQIPENIPPNAARDAEAAAMAAEGPSPARAAYGDQKFDAALSGFLAMIEEYNSSLQGAQ